MALRVVVLVLLASVLCSYAAANKEETMDCCLTTSKKPIPRSIVKSHSIQTLNGGCGIPATLFITKVGKRLCAPPASDSRWVVKLIKKLGKKPSKSQRQKKGSRP
ncbi:C-C motif chemokine 19-like [Megalops cyprinoides]|uniref:C-C motif chemokine 19-like n=1 Tax=Megalops cyprinoides TaxID=118141 RepID=UPI0018640456|nr:C-C motif chemokine 19-like [Megalops cyprinoides]